MKFLLHLMVTASGCVLTEPVFDGLRRIQEGHCAPEASTCSLANKTLKVEYGE